MAEVGGKLSNKLKMTGICLSILSLSKTMEEVDTSARCIYRDENCAKACDKQTEVWGKRKVGQVRPTVRLRNFRIAV